jgi:hypothetical protein
MTAQAGIEVETDLESLVGEFEEQACEHSQHGSNGLHADAPASHYVRAWCECANHQPSSIYAACPKFVAFTQSDVPNICPGCGFKSRANEMFEVLAPINSSTR